MPASKFSKVTIKRIVEAIRSGATIKAACEYGGISYKTHRSWIVRGELEKSRVASNPRARVRTNEKMYIEYIDAVANALASAEVFFCGVILQAAKGGKPLTTTTEFYDADGNLTSKKVTTTPAKSDAVAAAWALKNRFGYSQTDTIRVENNVQNQLDALMAEMSNEISTESLNEISAFLSRRVNGPYEERRSEEAN